MLSGYGPLILAGTWQTVKLAVLSLALAFVLGLIGAAARLSGNRVASAAGACYTTLIRSVPDLVLLLLLFYSIQIWLNNLTDYFGLDQINIDPFVAGVIVLGFIYGAYFTETFRGAFLAVPRGQLEAGHAYGMTRWQVFSRILFAQMMRFALPGIGNNWQVLVKSTALVSLISLSDLVQATQDAGKATGRMFFFTLLAGAVYLAITTISNFVLMYLEKRYSTGVHRADFQA
jgi:histidine transport system permease protein